MNGKPRLSSYSKDIGVQFVQMRKVENLAALQWMRCTKWQRNEVGNVYLPNM